MQRLPRRVRFVLLEEVKQLPIGACTHKFAMSAILPTAAEKRTTFHVGDVPQKQKS
jgi:hypothetical protein